ncbi:MAG TPA: hypothetical protein VN947_35195 [Polyangia bacterium]|nr:hypothetical protein [Polyangia bacterium]
MKTTRIATAVLALALPAAALAADAPVMPGQAVGRSALPSPVDESVAREAGAVRGEIGRLRVQQRGGHEVYSADLQGARNEIVTLDAHGRVLSRTSY